MIALAIAHAWLVQGCAPTPRVDLDIGHDAARAVGLDAPIEFRAVGPDGGPLDEPDCALGSLSLTDAVRRAVTTDPSLQASLARVRVALADADQARLMPNPILSVVLRWGPGTPQVEASLAQEFVRAIQIPRASSAADNRLRQTAAEAVIVTLDVASEAQERYVSAQASGAILPLLAERRSLVERLASVARARLAAGEGTRSDVATFEAQLVELDVEIDHATLEEQEARLRLARVVGQPSSPADWALDAWRSPLENVASEDRWIAAALAYRPEIQAIQWKLGALGDDESLARMLAWDGATAGVDASRDADWFEGPSVSSPLPVFDTGQARRARVTAEQLEARHELTLARRRVVEEVRLAHRAMTGSAVNLTRIRTDLIPLQQRRRSLAEDSYRAGQSDVTSLLLAEHDLRLSQTKAIEIERVAAIASVRLQRAVGGPGVASGVTEAPIPGHPPSQSGHDASH